MLQLKLNYDYQITFIARTDIVTRIRSTEAVRAITHPFDDRAESYATALRRWSLI